MAFMFACSGPPKLEEGERYFEGSVPFEYAESCMVSCILSADGQSVRRTRINMKKWSFEYAWRRGSQSRNIKENTASKSISLAGVHQLDANGNVEITTRDITMRFSIIPNRASGEMEYRYRTRSGDRMTINIPLGTYPFVMEDKTDSL